MFLILKKILKKKIDIISEFTRILNTWWLVLKNVNICCIINTRVRQRERENKQCADIPLFHKFLWLTIFNSCIFHTRNNSTFRCTLFSWTLATLFNLVSIEIIYNIRVPISLYLYHQRHNLWAIIAGDYSIPSFEITILMLTPFVN